MKLWFPGIHPSIPFLFFLIHPSLYESFNTIGRQRLYYDVVDPYIFTGWGCFREIPSIYREVGTNRPGQVGQSCSVVFSALPDDSILRAVTNELLPALQSQGGGGKMQLLGLDILYDSPIQQQPSRGSWHVEAQGIHHMMLHTLLWTLAMGEAFENINITYAYVDFEGCCSAMFLSHHKVISSLDRFDKIRSTLKLFYIWNATDHPFSLDLSILNHPATGDIPHDSGKPPLFLWEAYLWPAWAG